MRCSRVHGAVGETYATEDVLPRMARSSATLPALGRPYRLRVGSLSPADASISRPDAPAARRVARRRRCDSASLRRGPRSRSVTRATCSARSGRRCRRTSRWTREGRSWRDVAAQAGLVLRNVGSVADLRDSRRRIVAAQDERARKLERDIHDGAQQQLVALAVKLGLVERWCGPIRPPPRRMVAEAKVETNDALENLRDLARGIYPPLLADQGLAAALRSQARKAAIPVEVDPDGVGRYPGETEAAVYFSCLEALQNVAKYADASTATVRLAQSNGSLTFEVADDGKGFDPAAAERGSGLQGIADRLAALGGRLEVRSTPGSGTTIIGTLPAEVES